MIIQSQKPGSSAKATSNAEVPPWELNDGRAPYPHEIGQIAERLLNGIVDHLSGLLGDEALIRMCTLWVAQAHLGHLWPNCPWLYVGLPLHDENGQLVLDIIQPLMPVDWFANQDPDLVRKVTLKSSKTVHGLGSEAVTDLLQRLGENSSLSALIGHIVDPILGFDKDSVHRSVVVTGMSSQPNLEEFAQRMITFNTTSLACARRLSEADRMHGYVLRDDLSRWVCVLEDGVWQANTTLPDGLSGTSAGLWRPIFTIARLAGDEWHAWATQLAVQDALSKSYAALARCSDLVVNDECGRSISSWHKVEEQDLLKRVAALMRSRETALAHLRAHSMH